MATEIEILNDLYKQAKKLRKFLTKEEFGKALGYTRVYFTRITNGQHPMPTDLIDKAKALINDTKIVTHETDISEVKQVPNTDTMVVLMKNLLPKLGKISSIFVDFPLHRKQQLIKSLLPSPIWYNKIYSTTKVNELFNHKLLILNEKRLLKIEQPPFEFDGFPLSTPIGSITQLELLEDLYLAFSA